jgi:hypothetical protein
VATQLAERPFPKPGPYSSSRPQKTVFKHLFWPKTLVRTQRRLEMALNLFPVGLIAIVTPRCYGALLPNDLCRSMGPTGARLWARRLNPSLHPSSGTGLGLHCFAMQPQAPAPSCGVASLCLGGVARAVGGNAPQAKRCNTARAKPPKQSDARPCCA